MWRENNLRRLRLQHQITLRDLEADFLQYRGRLLEPAEDESHE